jgi:hypothetical protein
MPIAYTFPIWLLTHNDAHNHQVADMIEEDLESFIAMKKQFYSSLEGTHAYVQELHDLLRVFQISQELLITIFRTNVNIVNSQLPHIDVIRLKDRTKSTLSVWRHNCNDIVHPYSSSSFIDIIFNANRWDMHDKFTTKDGTPADWNGIVLSRLSDIHRNVSELFVHGESRLLVGREVDMSFRLCIASTMLPTMNLITQNLLMYKRLLDSF